MSLQGSLDTFGIPDVLRLLASTKKTGQLTVTGDRGTGYIWVNQGDLVGSEASAAPWASNSGEVVFELLRYSEGDFVFQNDLGPDTTQTKSRSEKVEPVINAANAMMKEWTEIVRVVPSLASPIRLAEKLPEPSVEINEASWRMIVGIGSGITVGELGNELEQSEIVVSRNLKQLIEAKLVEIEPAEPVLPGGFAPASPSVKPSVTFNRNTTVVSDEKEEESREERESLVEEIDVSDETVFDVEAEEPAGWTSEGTLDIDLEDEEQIAAIIEGLEPEILREVTKAVRADSDDERESILSEVNEVVSPVQMAAIRRFVYSLAD